MLFTRKNFLQWTCSLIVAACGAIVHLKLFPLIDSGFVLSKFIEESKLYFIWIGFLLIILLIIWSFETLKRKWKATQWYRRYQRREKQRCYKYINNNLDEVERYIQKNKHKVKVGKFFRNGKKMNK